MSQFQRITKEDFVNTYGADLLASAESPQVPKSRASQVGRGLLASVEGTLQGLSLLGSASTFQSPETRQKTQDFIGRLAPKPETKLERGSKTVGDIVQFFAPSPAGKSKFVTQGGGLASKVLGRAGGARFLVGEAAKDIGVSALQSPGQTPEEAASPVAEAGIGAVANILIPNVVTTSLKLFNRSVKNSASRLPTTVSSGANGLDVLEANVELLDNSATRTRGSSDPATGTLKDTPARRRQRAEATTPKLRLKERLLGIDPDLKQTLQSAGPELTQEYIDVVKTRNQIANFEDGSPVPTALAHAAGYVQEATASLARQLSDTGGEVGKFRQKVSTIRADRRQVEQITQSFEDALGRYNLKLNKQNQIVPVRGKISRAGQAEVNTMQRMYDNLLTVSEAPSVENLIEARMAFDELVNFASKDPTFNKNIVQDVSKATRSTIADVNRQIIGKNEAAMLERYSEMIDALSELTDYTDRRAGAEFLLKRVLSERDREARQVLQRVKEETGIDLFEHATLARVTTDFMANQRQKGLFRQEVTSAGGDIASILSGDKVGIVQRFIQRGLDAVTDEEAIILRASQPE